jgi:Ala-tRNA(Pro) deacylase
MLNKQLQDFLEKNHVKYDVVKHTPAYTAQEIAAMAHVPGKHLAKTVIVKIDGKLAMLVTPSTIKINFDKLKKELHARQLDLASEYEFQDQFPGCEVGAMPPFGNLFDMDVYADECLMEDREIAFNAGNHTELVKITYNDWQKLVKPRVVHLH